MLKLGITILGAIGLASLAGLIYYALQSESGHTGFNPYILLWIYVPLSVSGIIFYCFSRSLQIPRVLAASLLGIGLTGICTLLYLDKSGVLLEYHEWLRRGMH